MELINSEDKCRIVKVAYNEYEEEEETLIYEGVCRYQQGMQAYYGISQRNSVVFIPETVIIPENETIYIELPIGVKRKAVIITVRYIKMPLMGEEHTRLEVQFDRKVVEDSNGTD